ncbi:ketopantoate reductase family protein [Corynebacterium gerontici]|uniref:2-dehydropantoate 2-reductase n=1 Tax=Corynebacterium gerontici TaxID=2079234 RepID=A0A3G6IXI5_9CORY|nr:2-dehydropantoate 2-reductase [Corynebacterium gerontici]AZA10402.1 2-dehydropantoate 2-reductase [Corynebacterium gerontici]
MRILVYGAGAMGVYFALRLQQAGHELTLKARPNTPATLRLSTPSGQTSAEVRVLDELESEDFDLALVCTKAWQVPQAATEIGRHCPNTPIVTMQNGVTAPEHAHRAASNQIIAATCVVILERTAPSTVSLLGNDAQLTIGEFTPGNITIVLNAFASTPITVHTTTDIRRALWKKLSLIGPYGGIGAITGLSVGETRAHPSTRGLVLTLMEELRQVANAQGIELCDADVNDSKRLYLEVLDPNTTASMQRDLAEGKPSELDDQLGAVARMAKQSGVDTPVLNVVVGALEAREAIARG